MDKSIDFPMIMTYKDTENPNFEPYYYFLNGHNDVVYFADSNFTEEKVESYEYNPWGVVSTSIQKNNLLFRALYYEEDLKIYLDFLLSYSSEMDYYIYKIRYFEFANLYNIEKSFLGKIDLNNFIVKAGRPPKVSKFCAAIIGCPNGRSVILTCRATEPDCFCQCFIVDETNCAYSMLTCPGDVLIYKGCC